MCECVPFARHSVCHFISIVCRIFVYRLCFVNSSFFLHLTGAEILFSVPFLLFLSFSFHSCDFASRCDETTKSHCTFYIAFVVSFLFPTFYFFYFYFFRLLFQSLLFVILCDVLRFIFVVSFSSITLSFISHCHRARVSFDDNNFLSEC